jgi:hypothetical protein
MKGLHPLQEKWKIVVGNNPGLLNDLISMYHNSFIGGHSSSIVTAKKVGELFY